LQRRREGQTALIVYAGAAFAVTPLTDDVNTIRAQAADLETRLMPAQGGRAELAVDKAIDLLELGGVRRGHLLLITDHIDTGAFEAARERLFEAGHALSILGVGTVDGAPIPVAGGGFLKDGNGAIVIAKLNESELRRLAPYRGISPDDSDLDYLLPDSNPQLFADTGTETGLQTDTWRDEGPWLLLPLLLLTALAFRRGLLLWACLLLLPWPQPAQAFDWRELWLNDDQRGKRAFDTEHYESAQRLFDDPDWRAASAYRHGDYEQAAANLADATTPDGLYNRGNALARLGRIDEAIASYERALEQDPRHEDARHNRDLLQQQQQQQQNGESGQQSDSQQGSPRNPQSQQDPQQQQSGAPQDRTQDQQQPSQQAQNSAQPPAQEEQSSPQDPQQEEKKEQKQKGADPGQREREQAQREQAQAEAADETTDPERENMEQWLRRVPDDPGGLLKRKFLYQYKKQQQEQQQQPPEQEPW
jgi:Ca-activated chloride channel family protein